jgi:hypothetical protein
MALDSTFPVPEVGRFFTMPQAFALHLAPLADQVGSSGDALSWYLFKPFVEQQF